MNKSVIEFNPLKHHFEFIKKFLIDNSASPSELIAEKLKIIGHSATDVYLGKLGIQEIINQVLVFLKKENLLSKELFFEWVFNNTKEFQIIKLSDTSLWTLRAGKEPDKFVHLHPARNQPMVIRFKANTLKTALLFLASGNSVPQSNDDFERINILRKEFLKLPQVKSLAESKRLEFLINLLREQINVERI